MKTKAIFFIMVMVLLVSTASRADRVQIAGGAFSPLYGVRDSTQALRVAPFAIDRFPVTNGEYGAFLAVHPEWRPGNVPELMSDKEYLSHWQGHAAAGYGGVSEKIRQKPVVRLSWFAANDYCRWKGGRLPTVLEWEYVAAASAHERDASRDPAFVQELLRWYAKPGVEATALSDVGTGEPNAWGVHDLHGLVWEWTADFNSVFVGGDNRREGDDMSNLFCGAGAASGTDKANYAAFMRYALRNSLKGAYTTANLGFRCAYDLTPPLATSIRKNPVG